MSQLTLINEVPDFPAEFRVRQGNDQVARISVQADEGKVVIPTTDSYVATAQTTVDGFQVTSGPQYFSDRSAHLLAQVLQEDGGFDFQLVESAGTKPDAIVCENTWRQPVSFNVVRNGSPLGTVKVANEFNTVEISTEEIYGIYAIIDGVTTETLITDNPNATILAYRDNNDPGFSLKLRQG